MATVKNLIQGFKDNNLCPYCRKKVTKYSSFTQEHTISSKFLHGATAGSRKFSFHKVCWQEIVDNILGLGASEV